MLDFKWKEKLKKVLHDKWLSAFCISSHELTYKHEIGDTKWRRSPAGGGGGFEMLIFF